MGTYEGSHRGRRVELCKMVKAALVSAQHLSLRELLLIFEVYSCCYRQHVLEAFSI